MESPPRFIGCGCSEPTWMYLRRVWRDTIGHTLDIGAALKYKSVGPIDVRNEKR